MFINLDSLVKDGLLQDIDIRPIDVLHSSKSTVKLKNWKSPLLLKAAKAFKKYKSNQSNDFIFFCKMNEYWLDNYAVYKVLRVK